MSLLGSVFWGGAGLVIGPRRATFYRMRLQLIGLAKKEAGKHGTTCEAVAHEFVHRNGLDGVPAAAWGSLSDRGSYPDVLLPAVADLLHAHAFTPAKDGRPGSEQYAPFMMAWAMLQLDEAMQRCVIRALIDIIAERKPVVNDPEPRRPLNESTRMGMAAADVLVRMVHMNGSMSAAYEFVVSLSEMESDYVAVRYAEAEELLLRDMMPFRPRTGSADSRRAA